MAENHRALSNPTLASANDEFDLLRSLRLSSVKDASQLSACERKALADERHRLADETQYVEHLLQDKMTRMRGAFTMRGRVPKPPSYTRDSADRYGLFWFGQGKYEADEEDAARRERQRAAEEKLDIDEVYDAARVPEPLRLCVWRPVEAPPPPRGAKRSAARTFSAKSFSAKSFPAKSFPAKSFAKAPSPLSPPWAEHFAVDTAEQKTQKAPPPAAPFALPRGANGIDGVLQRARQAETLLLRLQEQRLREEREKEKRATRAALDAQIEDNSRRALVQYEADMVQQFGPAMRHILSDTFGLLGPPRSLPWQSAGGEENSEGHGNEGESDAARLKKLVRQRRERTETEEEKAHRTRQAWHAAWEIHKRNLNQ